ncbi:hypothetical protein GCM10027276_06360 [Comamonas piscis]
MRKAKISARLKLERRSAGDMAVEEEETEERDKGDTQANKGRAATTASGKCRALPQALLADGISAKGLAPKNNS